uniref:Ig-like domain-containing protein n=1 Tax=Varanus komodoensis TaxID=61221 RepID=A0A8D2IQP5_VARKO
GCVVQWLQRQAGILATQVPILIRALSSLGASPRRFLHQTKHECRFSNATGRVQVRFLFRHIYDRTEIARFDSARGRYEALTPLGEPDTECWNSQKEVLEDARAAVDTFCWCNYGLPEAGRVVGRRVQPVVTISPTKDDPLSPRTLLLCTAASFYPREIEVRWLKNGRRATEGVFYGEDLHNGDWTYQTQVMLEDTPQRGEIYTCQVEHASLKTPITVHWGMALLPLPCVGHSWTLGGSVGDWGKERRGLRRLWEGGPLRM